MLVKTKALVLSALKYQEKSLIVKCFTRSDGLKSYFVPSAFSSKKNNQKIAYFQPLTLLEIEAVHKNKGTLEQLREIKLSYSYQSLPLDITKSTIAIFLSEILHHSIREEEKNEPLFTFLETAFQWLDTHDAAADFHLILLVQVTKFLGFFPGTPNAPFFEMTDGVFVPLQGISCLNETESQLFAKLLQLRFEGSGKCFSKTERLQLLKILLDYYAIHLDGFKRPKSLDVLQEVFA